jgi:pseudouridine kinase
VERTHRIVCIGQACIDRTYRADDAVRPATSNPARARHGYGGVARNVAESLARLGCAATLLTAVGDDADGGALATHTASAGVDVRGWRYSSARPTGEYVAILEPDGELVVGACDAGPVEEIDAAAIGAWESILAGASWVFADCNLRAEALAALIALRARSSFRLAIDAVSAAKVLRLPDDLRDVDALFLNVHQVARLAAQPNARAQILTDGASGVDVTVDGATVHLDPVAAAPVDVTGAGDALIAGTLHRLLAGDGFIDAVRGGLLVAALTLESPASVRPDLSLHLLAESRHRL